MKPLFLGAFLVACGHQMAVPDGGNRADGSVKWDAPDADAAVDAAADSGTACEGPGMLDPSFGAGGIITSLFGPSQWTAATAVVMDASGRILVGGSSPWRGSRGALTVARLLPDGSFDPTFGGTGVVQVGVDDHDGWAEGITIQHDGRIVLAGGLNGADGARVMLVRLNEDGSQDATFGNNGVVVDTPKPRGHAVRVRLDAVERILVAVYAEESEDASSPFYFVAVRYTSDGARDTTFNGTGVVVPAFADGQHVTYDLVLHAGGTFDLVGAYIPFTGTPGFGIARYTEDGTLDGSFGSNGLDVLPFGPAGATGAFTTGQDLYVAGYGLSTTAIVAHVDAAGTIDTTFGAGGTSVAADRTGFRPALASASTFVVAGDVSDTPGDVSVRVGRYFMNGAVDTSFGVDGEAVVPLPLRTDTWDVAVQPDGRVLAVGGQSDGFIVDAFVLRLCP